MKTLMKLTTLLLLLGVTAHAQVMDSVAGQKMTITTVEEYNYLTKGYKVQIESGLDMKKGYSFGESVKATVDGKTIFQFRPLIRESTKEVCAVLLTLTVYNMWGETITYFCIPRNNYELAAQFNKDVGAKFFQDIGTAYARSTAQIMGEYFELKQKPK